MTDQALDMLMRRVLIDALRKEEESVIEVMGSFAPSQKHQRQMKEMLQDPLKWMRNKTRPVWKTIAQKVAVVLLIASVSLGGVMAVSPTVRATVIQWVTEWYETHIVYRFLGDAIPEKMPEYKIANLPAGFTENTEYRVENPGYIGVWYENQDGDVILFDYIYMQQGSAAGYVTDGSTVVPVEIEGLEGQLIKSNTPDISDSTLVWIDSKRNIQFSISAMLTDSEMVQMAESVSLTKSAK